MHPCDPVRPDELSQLPVQIELVHRFACTPAQLFASFGRAEDWKQWLDLEVTWTSEPPWGVGTTRTVATSSATFDEVFTQWVDGEVMGFYFSASSMRMVRQFAEEYRVRETPEGCELRWRIGIRLAWWAFFAGPVFRRRLTRDGHAGFPTLERLALEG